MAYAVISDTTAGDGTQLAGTFRSKARAIKITDLLNERETKRTGEAQQETRWEVHKVTALDRYTDESIIEWAETL